MVSQVVSDREVLLTHANWSRRGGIERNVRAVDVSAAGDWSEVRVWFAPLGGLGTSSYPVNGFIYSDDGDDDALQQGGRLRGAIRREVVDESLGHVRQVRGVGQDRGVVRVVRGTEEHGLRLVWDLRQDRPVGVAHLRAQLHRRRGHVERRPTRAAAP